MVTTDYNFESQKYQINTQMLSSNTKFAIILR